MINCSNCGYQNRDEEKICVRCGAMLVDPLQQQRTRELGDTGDEEGVPKWGSARFGSLMNLVVEVLETHELFIFDANAIEQISIGRTDPAIPQEHPNIDLATSGGLDKGVSRRHAFILRREGALHLMDNNSSNGTFLNGQRLVPQQARILRDGDDIRCGHIILRITFRSAQA